MDKFYRSKKYSKNTKPNRHRGQQLHSRFNSSSTTLNRCRRKKSSLRRRNLKEFVNERVYIREHETMPNVLKCWPWEHEEGQVEGWCDCQGWDEERQEYVCPCGICMHIHDPEPVRIQIKHSKSKHDIKPYCKRSSWKPEQKHTKKERWLKNGDDIERVRLLNNGTLFKEKMKRNRKPLRMGMRNTFQPFGSHPLDEPRWWFLLPNKNAVPRMDERREEHLLKMGHYNVDEMDRPFLRPTKSQVSSNTLSQKEQDHVNNQLFRYDDFGDLKCTQPVKMTNDICLHLLRAFKAKHISWYNIEKYKLFKPNQRKMLYTQKRKKCNTSTKVNCPRIIMPSILPYFGIFG